MNDATPSEQPVIRYYLPGEVRALRDADRRAYRRGVWMLFIYIIAVCVPVRIAFDLVVSTPKFHAEFLKPYGIYLMVWLSVTILIVGIRNVFRRRGP